MRRTQYKQSIDQAFVVHPIVAILGPRQCGKTTLAKQYIKDFSGKIHYFDLEDVEDLASLANPKLALAKLTGLIVIDEIQRLPGLFPTLRTLVDSPNTDQQFLILGSASRELIQQSSESLAGRIQYIELTPFNAMETQVLDQLWFRGGFPRSFLAQTDAHSLQWREAYIQTFLEQDIPNLGIRIAPIMMRRFWLMLTHYHGNICNYSELGRSLNLTNKTVRYYADILAATFMIRQLQPWFENISKRQVKSHKLFFRDSGLLHALLGIADRDAINVHPRLGASWEGFALEQVIHCSQARAEECFFWATQGHAELDLLIVKGTKRYGFEFKYTDQPKITKSMRIALQDLELDKITVIYPGEKTFELDEKIQVTHLGALI